MPKYLELHSVLYKLSNVIKWKDAMLKILLSKAWSSSVVFKFCKNRLAQECNVIYDKCYLSCQKISKIKHTFWKQTKT